MQICLVQCQARSIMCQFPYMPVDTLYFTRKSHPGIQTGKFTLIIAIFLMLQPDFKRPDLALFVFYAT